MSVSFLHSGREEIRPDWAVSIAAELDAVEKKLESVIGSDVSPAFELSMHLLSAGGKRIRPALVILSGLASGECDTERIINLAVAAELLHMASLVHDDVVDETRERRGVDTSNSKWGNKLSVLGGDYLLSKAFCLLANDGNTDVLKTLSSTAVRMTESEMLQAAGEGDLSAWESSYWRIIRDKTAEFMGACCACGVILSGADEDTRQALYNYGVELGLAFQITDDVLDIAGDPDLTGKETGTDLISGKFTLPVLLALKSSNSECVETLREMIAKGVMTRSEARKVAHLVTESGALELAREEASDCAMKARQHLASTSPSDYASALDSLATFVIDREV